jgi:hypothetical protein
MEMGNRFWLWMIALLVGGIIGGLILWRIFGFVWYTYGFLAMFVLLGGVLLLIGYIVDRRDARKRGVDY